MVNFYLRPTYFNLVEFILKEWKEYELKKFHFLFTIQEHSENTCIYNFVSSCKMQQQHWWISPL